MRNQKKTLERFFFQWHIVAKTTDKQWKAVDIDLKMSHTAVFSESQITTKYFIKMTKKSYQRNCFFVPRLQYKHFNFMEYSTKFIV